MERYRAMLQLIESGELTRDRMPTKFCVAEAQAKANCTSAEHELGKLLDRREYQRKGDSKVFWTHRETIKLIELVKVHGRDFKTIADEFAEQKTIGNIWAKIGSLKHFM